MNFIYFCSRVGKRRRSVYRAITRFLERQGNGDNQPSNTRYAIKVNAVPGNDQTRWRLQTRRCRP